MTPIAQPVTVPLREVEPELARQARALHGDDDSPLQRVRMSNLVIFTPSLAEAERLDAHIAEMVAAHPARVLLLIGEPGEPRELTATVTAWPVRIGPRRYACAEQVTLHAGGSQVHRLPFAVRALLIGDLPTNLWWAAPVPPPLAGPLLHELVENVQQILYDSLGWPDPARGVATTAAWLEQVERRDGPHWRVASDLNWRRLRYWRRLIKQSLDPATAPGAARAVTEILVEHGPHAVVQAWELASWLAHGLGWHLREGTLHRQHTEMSWTFATPAGEGRVRIRRLEEGLPEVRRVRIACALEGGPCAFNVVVQDEQRLAVLLEGVEGAPRTITCPPRPTADVVGRQLSDRAPDPAFRASMELAQAMARSLLE